MNSNLSQCSNIIQNFAFEPPFAITSTNVSSPVNLLTLQNGFPPVNATVTNNFAVDPNYRLGYGQLWNVDIQRQLPPGVGMDLGYNGFDATPPGVDSALCLPR